jgi:hypothetical protein
MIKAAARTFVKSLVVYVAGAVVLLLAMYGANQAQGVDSFAKSTGEAGSAVPTQRVTEWQEDSLPNALYEWVGEDGQSGDLQNWSDRDVEGHAGCWAAVADTTLIMCPDGFTTTS